MFRAAVVIGKIVSAYYQGVYEYDARFPLLLLAQCGLTALALYIFRVGLEMPQNIRLFA